MEDDGGGEEGGKKADGVIEEVAEGEEKEAQDEESRSGLVERFLEKVEAPEGKEERDNNFAGGAAGGDVPRGES